MYYVAFCNRAEIAVQAYSAWDAIEKGSSFNSETRRILARAITFLIYKLPFETYCLIVE